MENNNEQYRLSIGDCSQGLGAKAGVIMNSGTAIPDLWDATACAKFLGKSPRWIFSALTKRPDEPGSLPHVRVGSSPRFFPNDIAEWVRMGCPPAETFAEWRTSNEKKKSRN